ncbi:unnamed protein product [Rhizoctonia solani]|uniref:Protein kinase domain-containing protein n=1 Tax=Rhizoctonia solani TaxID=456999 RepID=A0A8H2XT70_9AGAM|nr:unnamed protein product [Rhizoctonia solani]
MDQERPLSIVELTARSKPTGYNAKKSFRTSLRIALDEMEAGRTAKDAKEIEQAFIHLTKAHTLLTEELPTHPKYPDLEPKGREGVIWKGQEVEIWLNETKALVGRRILNWKLRHLDAPSTPRSRVQSESGLSPARAYLKIPDPSAHPPPSPSRSAPPLSTPSNTHHSGRGHRRTSSDVGKATTNPKSSVKESGIRNRSHSPTSRPRLSVDRDQPSTPLPSNDSSSDGPAGNKSRPTPRILVRQATGISQQPNDRDSPNPIESLDEPPSSTSATTPAVPALILTDLSGEPSPSQLTVEESASVVTPSDATAFPAVQGYDRTNELPNPDSAEKTRPRTLSEAAPVRDRPLVGDQKETPPQQRPGSCPPVPTKEIPTGKRKDSTDTTVSSVFGVTTPSTNISEYFTAPVALQLALMEGMDVSSDPEHPESIAKLEEEAVSYLELEQFERATNILIEVLKLRRQVQGESHLFTIQTMSNLGLAYEGQGKIDQAIQVLLATLKHLERSHSTVNFRFRSSIQERLIELHQKQEEARKKMTVVLVSNLRRGPKRNNSLDQISTRVRFDENLPTFHIDLNTTPEAIMAHLTNRRCPNLTDSIDTARCGKVPVSRGGYGDIWQGMLLDGRPIAMKRIYQGERKINKRLAQELYAWSKASHDNVLELLGIAYYKDYLVMISPWMSYGSIHDYLECYPDTNRLHMAIQVADGIAHLHRIGMVHGDLKAQNVFVSKEGVLKVGDFGLAVMLGERSIAFQPSTAGANSSTPGTLRWMAPELYLATIGVSLESDIYSLGMTIYEIVSHRVPFSELHYLAVPAAVCIEKKIPTFPLEIKAMGQRGMILWDLLRRCWDHNPKQRPTADQVLREMHKVASH